MATEKNIAALLREDAKTIRVTFSMIRENSSFEGEPLDEGERSKSAELLRSLGVTGMQNEEGFKLYSYVTHYDVKPFDLVLVEAAGQLKAATVVDVDEEVVVEPGSNMALRWVVQKLDFTEYKANFDRNLEIERLVNEAYKANLRRSFRAQILSGLEGPAADGLTKLLGSNQ